MFRFLANNRLSQVLICFTIFATPITGSGDSIFEEDDIKGLSFSPPAPYLGTMAPGTKWCGPGNTALNYDDLGPERETDMCCREHDHCDDVLNPLSTVHGLKSHLIPIFNCSCEQKFMNCLKAVNNTIANTLGGFYFSARKHCMAENSPIVDCKEYQSGVVRKRCIRYNMDTRMPKTWQFFNMPFYTQYA